MGTLAAIKLGLGISAFVLVIGGGFWFVHHERDVGAAKCEAAVKAATDTEIARQSGVNDYWQKWGAGAVANADQQKAHLNDLQKQVADASASLKGRACVPASIVDKLRAIDLPGGKANPPASPGGAR